MPKVTQQYRDARREQILSAAKRCFLRDGFHETSMQNLFAEAGMSAGAVYRYFSGKDDMILAIVEENMREVLTLTHSLAGKDGADTGGLGDALASVLEVIREKHARDGLGALAVLVWSEALRNPTLARRFEASLDELRGDLAELIGEQQQAGNLPAGARPAALASLLMAVIPGFILQLALFGERTADGIADAARAMWPS